MRSQVAIRRVRVRGLIGKTNDGTPGEALEESESVADAMVFVERYP